MQRVLPGRNFDPSVEVLGARLQPAFPTISARVHASELATSRINGMVIRNVNTANLMLTDKMPAEERWLLLKLAGAAHRSLK